MAETANRSTTEVVAKLYDGKLRLERRNGSSTISARTFLQGKLIQKSTGERTLHPPQESRPTGISTFATARGAASTCTAAPSRPVPRPSWSMRSNCEVSEGQRRNYRQKWALLKDHFQAVKVNDVDARFLLTLREKRAQVKAKNGQPVKSATLKKDMDFVRLVLRYAKNIEKNLSELPEFPSFRGEAWEVVPSPRPFLDHDQWVKLRKLGLGGHPNPAINRHLKTGN